MAESSYTPSKGLLVLGNQLFDLSKLVPGEKRNEYIIFIREDIELCTYFKFHKQKIAFFFLAMRQHAMELRNLGFQVHYETFQTSGKNYEAHFLDFIFQYHLTEIHYFEIEDKFFESRILATLSKNIIKSVEHPSPMFLTSRREFSNYLANTKKPFMKTFYQKQRIKLNILLDENKMPAGGSWSYDTDNRKKLPKSYVPKNLPTIEFSNTEELVLDLINQEFPSHPGDAHGLWLPTSRKGAEHWLDIFLNERLHDFGPYEDALSTEFPFLNHSILSPFLNIGLLTPAKVIEKTFIYSASNNVPIASLEGFVRQIIGWREFIRGIYQNYGEIQLKSNFFGHNRKLTKHWYDGTTGIPPLDEIIQKCNKYAYAHHIERLMVVGSLMVLFEIHPLEVYRWFMEMFIDSSDWVMVPNVFGMALFSDGGIFSTKPYICGSNYYRKMGTYPKGKWENAIDGLYWSFIEKHQVFLKKNPRLSMLVETLQKMSSPKKTEMFALATEWKLKLTYEK